MKIDDDRVLDVDDVELNVGEICKIALFRPGNPGIGVQAASGLLSNARPYPGHDCTDVDAFGPDLKHTVTHFLIIRTIARPVN